ncbi:ABC-2 type transporter [Helicosporidium sp. ATCC 50920]|nr:ABC-2 type transporter [Helicosporidium sp. ATCC 50920]|eukprot:KDD75002.1 ABC-2 type transporter [Helicosporidium sp. ATCC 50920]
MGASGAGKTTLMDVLAGRKTGGVVAGEIRVNGHPKNQSTFNRVSGYVEQEDVHLPQATVGEALRFSAALRLPSSVDPETRERFVREVISLVELERLEQAFVGVPGESGLSIQQRKRLTIAVELVANPSAIFMDEPTTGLDARAATVVMASVRAVVDTGRTVVCTIHQPSLDIFEEFDELLLLKPGGRCVYFGALGRESASLIAYFGGVPGTPPLPAGVNPANWMLEVTGPAAEASRGVDYAREYEASQLRAAAESMLERVHQPKPDVADLTLGELEVTRPSRQFALLVRRFLAQGWRMPDYNLTRFGVTLLVAFVEGSIAWKQGDDRNTVAGVMNIAGLLYMSTLFIGITNCMSIMPVAVTQRAVMYRERAAGMYGIGPYALAQGVVELPYILVQTVVYSAIVYWMMAFIPSAAKFFWFCFFFGLTLIFFTAFGLLCVALTPDIAIASLFSSFFFGFWNLICGFLQVQSAIPGWWIWAYYLNPVSWSLYGLIVSQLGDLYDEYIVNFDGQTVSISAFIQDYLGFKYSFIWPCVGILLGFIVVFRTSTFAALKLLNFQNR